PTDTSPSYTTANPTPLDSMVCQQSVNISEKEELSTRLRLEKGKVIFSLASESWARLTVYDATGRLVARPIDGILRAGEHAVELGDLQKGVYLVQLDVGASNTEPARAKLVIR
ncbi:MAG: T9SS type A sorting domain-containing protein, partial [candidate division WOR-3 bacterium]